MTSALRGMSSPGSRLDNQPWGAYSVELVFAEAVSKQCAQCSEEDRQIAQVIALDSASRVTVLTEMLAGQLGSPDMSSAGVRD